MDGGTAGLDSSHRIQGAYRSLEWLQVAVLVGEHAETAGVYSKTDTDVDVLLGGFEPSIPLRLRHKVRRRNDQRPSEHTCLKI